MHNLKNKRIMVTGGAGLVGSHTCDLLIKEQPKEIIIFDDFSRGTRQNIEDALKSGIVKVVEGDIRDIQMVHDVFFGIDYCFHLAAIRITECAQEPRKCMETLVNGTFNVLEACVKNKVKKVVAASSASVYGMAEVFPTKEAHHLYNNRTIYGAAKVFNEQLLRSFNEMYGLDYVALRYFNIYGPRMDAVGKYTEVLIRWMDCLEANIPPKIFGDGLTSMDFIFIRDIARANILAMQNNASDMVFNIASGKETTLRELSDIFLKLTKSFLKPVYQEERKVNAVRRRLALTELAQEHINFRAEVTLEEGIKELIEWHKSLKK